MCASSDRNWLSRVVLAVIPALLLAACVMAGQGTPASRAEELAAQWWPCVGTPHTRVMLSSEVDEKISRVLVDEGDRVEAGQTLLTLESMKMQHQMTAAISGRVEAVMTAAGDQVKPRQVLVRLTQEETEGEKT